MRENLVITWPCVGPFPSTTTTLKPITEKELKRKKKQQQQQQHQKKKKKNSGMRKWQMLAASKVKMSGSEKKMERTNIRLFLQETYN